MNKKIYWKKVISEYLVTYELSGLVHASYDESSPKPFHHQSFSQKTLPNDGSNVDDNLTTRQQMNAAPKDVDKDYTLSMPHVMLARSSH